MPYSTSLSLESDITRAGIPSNAIKAANELTFKTQLPSTGSVDPGFPWPKTGSRFSDSSSVCDVHRFSVLIQVVAWLDYPGYDLDDLPLKAGDVIDVVEYLNSDWWRGVITVKNMLGIFPTAYVWKLDPPTSLPTLRGE
ncbi:hypothetical protein BGX30_011833 [Mortierella sp. GBA39]|nr:hypothetical protein BGX30_011833 [Mortierella sp. GBA39]